MVARWPKCFGMAVRRLYWQSAWSYSRRQLDWRLNGATRALSLLRATIGPLKGGPCPPPGQVLGKVFIVLRTNVPLTQQRRSEQLPSNASLTSPLTKSKDLLGCLTCSTYTLWRLPWGTSHLSCGLGSPVLIFLDSSRSAMQVC